MAMFLAYASLAHSSALRSHSVDPRSASMIVAKGRCRLAGQLPILDRMEKPLRALGMNREIVANWRPGWSGEGNRTARAAAAAPRISEGFDAAMLGFRSG